MNAKLERRLHGSDLYRSTIKVLVAGTPKDTTNTTGTQYTFSGGEVIQIQAIGGAAYIEIIASGSMTASGGKAFVLEQNEKYELTLKAGVTTLSADGVTGAVDVVVTEKQSDA